MFNKKTIILLTSFIFNILLILCIILPYNFINQHYYLSKITHNNYIPVQYSCESIVEENDNISQKEKENILTHAICLSEDNNYYYEGFINDDLFVLTDQPGDYLVTISTPYPLEEYSYNSDYLGPEGLEFKQFDGKTFLTTSSIYTMKEEDIPYVPGPLAGLDGGKGEGDITEMPLQFENYSESVYLFEYYDSESIALDYPPEDRNVINKKYLSSTFTVEKKD